MRQSDSSNPSATKMIASISLLRLARGMMMRGFSSMCVVVAIENSQLKPKTYAALRASK
jgi:hypothetical protein